MLKQNACMFFYILDIYHCYINETSVPFLSACQVHLLYYDSDQTALQSFTYYTNDTNRVSGIINFHVTYIYIVTYILLQPDKERQFIYLFLWNGALFVEIK